MSVIRGGRKRTFKTAKEYKLHLRAQIEATGGTASDTPPGHATAVRCTYYGSKCYKGPADRRPNKGGKVRGG